MNDNMNQGMNDYNNNNGSMMDLNMLNQDMMMGQNTNNNISEQDLIIQQKIEKREKFDTILAYVLIAVLLACIGIITFLKFNKKEEPPAVEDPLPKYISLNEIATSLNSSQLATSFKNDGANLNSAVSGESLVVTYTKGDTVINLNMPLLTTELELVIPNENQEIVEDIYKEIANTICIYYSSDTSSCRMTADSISETSTVEGIRYVNASNINTLYIDITKAIENKITYNEVTKVDIKTTDYTLNLSNYKIENIKINNDGENISISGRVNKTGDESNNFSVIVKLYDSTNNKLAENKYEFNDTNTYEESNLFSVSFLQNNELKIENVAKYSIEIEK